MPLRNYHPTVYIGPSMNPTLKAPDILEITPYKGAEIKVGDVIVFSSPKDGKSITHRVIMVTRQGAMTQGDNNRNVDPWLLKPEAITGRVDWAKRGKKRMRIWGGKKGERLAFYLHARLHLSRATTKMLYPLYRLIHKPGTLRKIADRHLAKKVVVFNKQRGKELLLLFGKMVIGRKRPGMPWQIKLPFRLLIDETNLPQ